MCGRFSLLEKLGILVNKYAIKEALDFHWQPSYNIAPGHNVPVILRDGLQTKLVLAKWGFSAKWHGSEGGEKLLINARAEGIETKPTFKKAIANQRCLVPFSNFFEWQKSDAKSAPYYIGLKDSKLGAFAGIWEENKSSGLEKIGNEQKKGNFQAPKINFSIITTEPNSLMKPIHNRMPVILEEKEELKWIDPDLELLGALQMLKPYDAAEMKAYEISPEVNSPRNNSPSILNPVFFRQQKLGI